MSRSVSRRSSVSPSRTILAGSLPFSPRTTRAGSAVTPSGSTAARSSEVSNPQPVEVENMSKTTREQNKALVLKAFDTLFNRRDYEAAAGFWSDEYIQHSAHIEPGREGLFDLIRRSPDNLHYEHQHIVAEGDYVIVHGRFTG